LKIATLIALAMLLPAPVLAAGGGGVATMCWSAAQLAANPDERSPRRLKGVPDTQPVARELAPFDGRPQADRAHLRSLRGARHHHRL
jgi:hypothetical protein